jgi:hypothetical protein
MMSGINVKANPPSTRQKARKWINATVKRFNANRKSFLGR